MRWFYTFKFESLFWFIISVLGLLQLTGIYEVGWGNLLIAIVYWVLLNIGMFILFTIIELIRSFFRGDD